MLFYGFFVITERRHMGMYEVSLSMSLLGFGMGTMLAHFHMCGVTIVSPTSIHYAVCNM